MRTRQDDQVAEVMAKYLELGLLLQHVEKHFDQLTPDQARLMMAQLERSDPGVEGRQMLARLLKRRIAGLPTLPLGIRGR